VRTFQRAAVDHGAAGVVLAVPAERWRGDVGRGEFVADDDHADVCRRAVPEK
jgi:hypothetical protein